LEVRLVLDASVLVAEFLRRSGRELLARPELELYLPEHGWREAMHEFPKRVRLMQRRYGLTERGARELTAGGVAALEAGRIVVAEAYQDLEVEARARLRDPDDWPVLALALTLDCGIWTADQDFFGTGVATWTTANLRRALEQRHSN
jgi:predicted nucleic acid-binding protein